MKVYLDSCIVIGLLTGAEDERQKLRLKHPIDKMMLPCVSGIVKTECLVDVYRRNDEQLALEYARYFSAVNVLQISDAACDLAARIRAATRLKLPDALHLAIAEENGCTQFWTSDRDFKSLRFQLNLDICVSDY